MKTRWLAFAVARSQLVASTRYNNECCVSNVAAEVLPDAVDVRCLCGTAMTPALLKGPMQRSALLWKAARTRGRARGDGHFVSGCERLSAKAHKTSVQRPKRCKKNTS